MIFAPGFGYIFFPFYDFFPPDFLMTLFSQIFEDFFLRIFLRLFFIFSPTF